MTSGFAVARPSKPQLGVILPWIPRVWEGPKGCHWHAPPFTTNQFDRLRCATPKPYPAAPAVTERLPFATADTSYLDCFAGWPRERSCACSHPFPRCFRQNTSKLPIEQTMVFTNVKLQAATSHLQLLESRLVFWTLRKLFPQPLGSSRGIVAAVFFAVGYWSLRSLTYPKY